MMMEGRDGEKVVAKEPDTAVQHRLQIDRRRRAPIAVTVAVKPAILLNWH